MDLTDNHDNASREDREQSEGSSGKPRSEAKQSKGSSGEPRSEAKQELEWLISATEDIRKDIVKMTARNKAEIEARERGESPGPYEHPVDNFYRWPVRSSTTVAEIVSYLMSVRAANAESGSASKAKDE